MRVATKINLVILLVFAASMLANYQVMKLTVQPRFNELEQEYAKVNHKRIIDALGALSGRVEASAQDYGLWDDAYDFMRGHNHKKFIAANLNPPTNTIEGLGINAMIFRNLDGSVRWGHAIDLTTKQPLPGLAQDVAKLPFKHPFLSGGTDPLAKVGLMQSSQGLMMVAVVPILKTDRLGLPAGELLAASLFNVSAAKALTGVGFTLEPLSSLPESKTDIVRSASSDHDVTLTSLLKDISGNPLTVLRSVTPRYVSMAGTDAIWKATLLMLDAAAAVIFILWIAIRHLVIERLVKLNDHLATAADGGNLVKHQHDGSQDEIGQVTCSFNAMADQVNHLRDALADSSFMSGMSEWAAGTLHNVRNGLNPVTVATWRLGQLFDPAWLDNIRTALDDHNRPDVPLERREKLKDYLIACAARVLTSATEVKQLSKQIEAANKDVIDITNQFEKFTRRETQLESVDMLALVQDVAKTVSQSQAKLVCLDLPSVTQTVLANKTILRQVLTNVFINAFEAMDCSENRGQIVVSLKNYAGSRERVRLSIADNGEGIAAERLKTIFERGHSSRTHRSGGLGLHWCANAVKAMGGSVKAFSRGMGQGATITISLNSANSISQEAA